MKLPRLSIDNYQFTILVFLMLTLLGVNSFLNMPRMENPEMTIPGGSVYVVYPGANPVDLERLIANPLEEAINELEDIKKIETYIRDGLVVISVEFFYGTIAKDKYDELLHNLGLDDLAVKKINEINTINKSGKKGPEKVQINKQGYGMSKEVTSHFFKM